MIRQASKCAIAVFCWFLLSFTAEAQQISGPDSIFFPTAQVGQTRSASLIYSNIGTETLSIDSVVFAGPDAAEFSLQFNDPFQLPPNGQHVNLAFFEPQVAGEKDARILIFSNNVGVNPYPIELVATAVPAPVPDIQLNTDTLSFSTIEVGDSTSLIFSISNNGGAALTIDSTVISGPGSASFFRDNFPGSFSVPAGGFVSLLMGFSPQMAGVLEGQVDFYSNDPDESPVGITLLGEGLSLGPPEIEVSPLVLDMDSVEVGLFNNLSLLISNVGQSTLVVDTLVIVGPDSGEFNLSALSGDRGPFSLPGGASRGATVFFEPLSAGNKSAILEIYNSDGDENPVLVSLSGIAYAAPNIVTDPVDFNFGEVLLGDTVSQQLNIYNTGSAELVITETRISSGEPIQYSILSGGGMMTIAPGDSAQLTVGFHPVELNDISAGLVIESNDPNLSPLVLNLFGTGVDIEPIPDIIISPDSLNFAGIAVGDSVDKILTLSNVGSGTLTISSTSIAEPDSSHFRIAAGNAPHVLQPGFSTTMTLRFSPTSIGEKSVQLLIENDDPDEVLLEVPLVGVGLPSPQIEVSPDTLNFGELAVGGSAAKQVIVYNVGTTDLTVQQITIVGTDSLAFQLQPLALPQIIYPQDSILIDIQFFPQSVGIKEVALQVTSNDQEIGLQEVLLHGLALPVPQIVVMPDTLDYGELPIGDLQSDSIRILNLGMTDLKIQNIEIVGADAGLFILPSDSLPYLVSPQDSIHLSISFLPTNVGEKTARLRIASDDLTNDTLYVELLGSGIEEQQPPALFFLGQNYPNPFLLCTEVEYGVADGSGLVKLKIYDARGALIKMLVEGNHDPGSYTVKWDGRNSLGERVASGLYFYQLNHVGQTITKKMLLLR
ncbi:MAG: choice-of-anchor D domain-containing protein [Calditrichia bacterium]